MDSPSRHARCRGEHRAICREGDDHRHGDIRAARDGIAGLGVLAVERYRDRQRGDRHARAADIRKRSRTHGRPRSPHVGSFGGLRRTHRVRRDSVLRRYSGSGLRLQRADAGHNHILRRRRIERWRVCIRGDRNLPLLDGLEHCQRRGDGRGRDAADPIPVTTSGVSVSIAIETNPASGVLAGTLTALTDGTGTATFAGLSVNAIGAGYTLVATSAGLTATASPLFDVVKAPLIGPALGRAASYSVFGSAVTNTGVSTISGDAGSAQPGAVTGFPNGSILGETHAGDVAAAGASTDFQAAYTDALGRTPDTVFAGDQSGSTFVPGVHSTGAAFALGAGGILTLDAQGDSNAVFIFKVNAALNTGAGSTVNLVGGAQASHVFWQVNGAAGTGADSSFVGTLLTDGAITIGARGQLKGRALASGAVTLATNTIGFS